MSFSVGVIVQKEVPGLLSINKKEAIKLDPYARMRQAMAKTSKAEFKDTKVN